MKLNNNKKGVLAPQMIILILVMMIITGLAVKSYYLRNPITETVVEVVEVEVEVTKTSVAVGYEAVPETQIIYTNVTDRTTCHTALLEHEEYDYELYGMAVDEPTCAESTDGFCHMTDRGVYDSSLYVGGTCCLMKCKVEV